MMDNKTIVECSIDFEKVAKGADGEINIGGEPYLLQRLNKNFRRNKGGNSWVFSMFSSADCENIEDRVPLGVIKINKADYYNSDGDRIRSKNKRIDQEIEALYKCNDKSANYVMKIYSDGILRNTIAIPDEQSRTRTITHTHRFYVMEYAKHDLKEYKETYEIDYYEKIKICIELTKSLRELLSLGYYHRDIKPDNFFYLETGEWKIGDLGLVRDRNKSDNDEENEFIGPRGWTSPETMNKYLLKDTDKTFDRFIDDKSDMFQLGMVFWYVLQGNAPIGVITDIDFHVDDHDLYILIRTMVNHNKSIRPKNYDEILKKLDYIANKQLV